MYALQYAQYSGPEVLQLRHDVPEPHAGKGQVRIAVHAMSVNPYDWKLRAGFLDGMVPVTFPMIPGQDAAGLADEVGEGVEGVSVGDRVAGLGTATAAEFAVLDAFALVPEALTWTQAGALGLSVETAERTLNELGVAEGHTLLIEGGSGGVGTAAVQLARRRGARVIATSSAANQDYLRSLGADAVLYGDGLSERVRALAPAGVDAVLDCAGSGSLVDLIAPRAGGQPGRQHRRLRRAGPWGPSVRLRRARVVRPGQAGHHRSVRGGSTVLMSGQMVDTRRALPHA